VSGNARGEVDAFPNIIFRSFADFPSEAEQNDPEFSKMCVVYDAAAFAAIQQNGKLAKLNAPNLLKVEAPRATIANWDKLSEDIQGSTVVVCVGGGTCIDAGKWAAAKLKVRLVCLPSALSVDAFFTGWSGYRKDGCVSYDRTKAPDQIVVDLEVLGEAPQRVRAAGLCDVLSIATGLADWRYAQVRGNQAVEHRFDPMAAAMADTILQAAIDCAESAGKGEPAGLRRLIDVLCLEVTLCNQIGHSRPEEGSEHYLCYCLEDVNKETGRTYTHAEFVGPGLLVMGALQGIDVEPIRKAYKAAKLSYSEFPAATVREALRALPGYCKRHTGLAYSIAHDLTTAEIEALDIEALLAA
jgi:glycerol-1-phosphate dehydrogenase [NAD(P)+]